MKRISIGSWAYSIGPYAANPVPFDEVIDRVAALGFDGIELGGFPPHPNPDDMPSGGEFEPGFAFNKPSDIERIVDEVDESNFGVLFDTCHAHMVAAVGARQVGQKETLPGGALELAERLRGKIGHVHLIDSDGTLHD